MQMNRQWMYGSRVSSEFIKGFDGAVMMMWELLLPSPATATANFWCQVDVGLCSK
jgi:hypothetical protein